MNLVFWKKKTAAEDSEDGSQKKPDDRTVPRKPPGRESRCEETSEDTDAETANASPARSERRLIAGAVAGVLILAAAGLTTWKIFLSSPKKDAVTADTPAVIQPLPLPEKQLIKLPPAGFSQLRKARSDGRQTDIEALEKNDNALQTQNQALKVEPARLENLQSASRQAEIDTLKKQNSELQTQIGELKAGLPQLEKAQTEQHQANIDSLAKKNSELHSQIETLKKKQQQPSASPADQTAGKGKTQPPSRSGDMTVGSKKPKAAAKTLKEAIEAMNAGSGDSPKKAAK